MPIFGDHRLDGVDVNEVRKRLVSIGRQSSEIGKGRKLYGHLFDDVLTSIDRASC
ncbi:MAG TPA: hypothetical protein PKM25_04470 [Candidatus Ozemobacteraceae bacterium]|nr:hypothetical protein [Candidatus Ozemobacteraceae bacterium]